MHGRYWDHAESILSKYDFFNDYRAGKTNKAVFIEGMKENESAIKTAGIDGFNFNRLLKCPSGDRDIEAMLEEFRKKGGIESSDYNREEYLGFSDYVKPIYTSGGFNTMIFPEDELFMYAIAKLTSPKTMFIAGAYFGYWALWAMPMLKLNGGVCTLSDVNPAVIEVAEKNLSDLGYEKNIDCIADDAEKLLLESDEPIDLLALDAYGNNSDPRPTHRGKALYAPLLRAARHRLRSGSFIIIHNLERYVPELKPLIEQLDEISSACAELETFNGLGIYRVK